MMQVERDVEEVKRRSDKREGLRVDPAIEEPRALATVRARLAAAGRSPEDIQMILDAIKQPSEAAGQAKAKVRPNPSNTKGASAAQEQTAQAASGNSNVEATWLAERIDINASAAAECLPVVATPLFSR